MSNGLAIAPAPAASSSSVSIYASRELFQLTMEQAEFLAKSTLIPTQFQGNAPNCMIALEVACRLGASPFMIIQNIDVIHGRPSFRAKFLTALVNSCGRFEPLQFDIKETGAAKTVKLEIEYWTGYKDNRKKATKEISYTYTPTTCIAWAVSKLTGERVEGPPVSFDMALEEGWVAKDGSKWLTEMRHLMIRYRAAAYFANIHASDVMFGMRTDDEEEDIHGMRMARGREIASDPEPSVETAANPFRKGDAKGEKQAPPSEAAPAARPTRDEMSATIRAAVKDAKLTFAKASAIFKDAGLLKAEKFADATDDEYFAITQQLDLLQGQGENPPPAAASTEKTPAQRKEDALAQIDEALTTGFDTPITRPQFEAMLRKQSLLGQTGTLMGMLPEKLENVAASVAHIVEIDRKGGDQ